MTYNRVTPWPPNNVAWGGYCGLCPRCRTSGSGYGRHDMLDCYGEEWIVCHEHKTKWLSAWTGAGTAFTNSGKKDMAEAREFWDQNRRVLETYAEVNPVWPNQPKEEHHD